MMNLTKLEEAAFFMSEAQNTLNVILTTNGIHE
jgi:hypothetical protein